MYFPTSNNDMRIFFKMVGLSITILSTFLINPRWEALFGRVELMEGYYLRSIVRFFYYDMMVSSCLTLYYLNSNLSNLLI